MFSAGTDEDLVWEMKQLPMEMLTRALWEALGAGAKGAQIDYASPLSSLDEERGELLCGIAQELVGVGESEKSDIQLEVCRELLVHLVGGRGTFSESSGRRFAAGSAVQ